MSATVESVKTTERLGAKWLGLEGEKPEWVDYHEPGRDFTVPLDTILRLQPMVDVDVSHQELSIHRKWKTLYTEEVSRVDPHNQPRTISVPEGSSGRVQSNKTFFVANVIETIDGESMTLQLTYTGKKRGDDRFRLVGYSLSHRYNK